MIKVDALEYFGLGARSADTRWLFMLSHEGLGGPAALTEQETKEIEESMRAMNAVCEALSLKTSLDVVKTRLANPPKTRAEFEILVDMVRSELKGKLFLFVPEHRSKYYDLILQSTVTTAFPLASNELVEAGNCLAAGLFTACVFHSMRAAEIGVRVLGTELGVTFPEKPIELAEWQNILDQADSKIVEMRNLKRGPVKDQKLHFFSQAAVQFRYFKDAWRVRVAHARESYDERRAISIFTHTLEFFDFIAAELSEPEPSI
jgi:hypothetical protein